MIRGGGLRVDGDFRIGHCLVESRLNAVTRDGLTLRLEPKVMQVLVQLAERAGEVLSKDQLLETVWVGTYVTEDVLTRSVSELRRALADDVRAPRFIQTIPKRGYRLICPVERIEPDRPLDSIAVLPFLNAENDPELEYLCEGITDCLINALAQLPALRVVARNTVFRFKGHEADARSVGRDLNVRTVLVGRVTVRQSTLVVNAELVDVAQGRQLWGERLTRSTADILALEKEIAGEITAGLQFRLSPRERELMAKRSTENFEAFHLYLKARHLWHRGTERSVKAALSEFQAAIARDSGYARAYAGLADCYSFLACQLNSGSLPPHEACPEAESAAKKALELDPGLAESHASLASVLKNYRWDWAAAEQEFTRAIALNSNYPKARQSYADLLVALGRVDEAIRQIQTARELDPFGVTVNTDAGNIYYLAGDYEKAVRQLQLTLELWPDYVPARSLLGFACERLGRREESAAHFEKARRLCHSGELSMAVIGRALTGGNDQDLCRAVDELRELSNRRYLPAYFFAALYLRLGRGDEAFEWMEKALGERSNWLLYLNVDPIFDAVRADARFQDLARRVGLHHAAGRGLALPRPANG